MGYGITLRLRALESAIIPDRKVSGGAINGGISLKDEANHDANEAPFRQIGVMVGGMDGVMAERTIMALRENPHITQAELANSVGIPLRSLQRALGQMKDLGLIVRKGGNRFGHWEIDDDHLNHLNTK